MKIFHLKEHFKQFKTASKEAANSYAILKKKEGNK